MEQAKKESRWIDLEAAEMVSVNPGKAFEVQVDEKQEKELEQALDTLKKQNFEEDMEVSNKAFLDVLRLCALFGTKDTQKMIEGYVAHVGKQVEAQQKK